MGLLQVLTEGILPTSIALICVVLVSLILYRFLQDKGLPPGPTGLPFVGYLPFLRSKTCHLQLDSLKGKYGDVYSFRLLGRLYINLGSAKAVREVFISRSECFRDRPIVDFSLMTWVFFNGVTFSNGERWQTMRKYFLQELRERGMTSASRESLGVPLTDAMSAAVRQLRESGGKPISVVELLHVRCNRILQESLFGEGGISLQEVQQINDIYKKLSDQFASFLFLLSGNLYKYLIAPFVIPMRELRKNRKTVIQIIHRIIERQKKQMDDTSDDLISSFHKERAKRQQRGDPTYKYFTDEMLAMSLLQFVGDGALTVAVFVGYIFKVLLDHPEEQEKLHRELLEVVGPDRQPTVEDKSRLPYFNAFINEALRKNDSFPFFPSVECTKETTVGGYRFPKGAVTLTNMWSVHNDPHDYEEPKKFDPSRFLPTDGKGRPELPITFGVGKRSCLGEGFVMIQVFLFLTTLIRNFKLTKFENDYIPKSSIDVLRHKQLLICAEPRN